MSEPSTSTDLQYMTVKEVAEVLRKHPITIYRWLEAGRVFVDVPKVGQSWLIPRYQVFREAAEREASEISTRSRSH